MSDAAKQRNELPSVDDVIASLKARGVTSFVKDEQPQPEMEQASEETTQEQSAAGEEGTGQEAAQGNETQGDASGGAETAEAVPPAGGESKGRSSAEYVDLVRRQRELAQRAQEVSRQTEQFKSREQQLKEELDRLKGNKPKTPMEALKAAGYSYEDVTSQVLGGWKEPEVDPLEQKIKPVVDKLTQAEETIKRLEARIAEKEALEVKARAEQAKSSVLKDIQETAKSQGFDYIDSIGSQAYDAVNTFMLEYYKQHQVVLDIKDACAIINSEYEKMLGPVFKSDRIKKKYGFASDAPVTTPASKPVPAPKAKTLTNTRSTGAPAKSSQLEAKSDAEAMEAVAKMLKFVD